MSEVPSRQEMFNRAWNGLKSQGWKKSLGGTFTTARCRYVGDGGMRCAWGWVDPGGTWNADGAGDVRSLRSASIGLAAHLSDSDCDWAKSLQRTHDESDTHELETGMRRFARTHGLTIPD